MKNFLLLLLLAFSGTPVMAQQGKLDKKQTLTWLGIDFSQLKFIGNAAQWKDAGAIDDEKLSGTYFQSWNNLVTDEPDKFDLKKATGFSAVEMAPEVATAVNQKSRKKKFLTEDGSSFEHLTEASIQKQVSQYSFGKRSGTGLVFIVAAMDKGREAANIWVVYVDMKTKKVLAAKNYTSKAGGFGFRNYWAGAIKNTLKSMKKDFK